MISNPPIKENFTDPKGNSSAAWLEFMSEAFYGVFAIQRSGTTAQRPTKRLWIGMFYYDTTLGYPVYVNSVNPVVWHNGAGAVV